MVAAALAQLDREDPALAKQADAALNALTWDEGLATITQMRLQEWLWYGLPVKFWTDLAEWVQIATALGRLLDLVELPRYGALCRGATTHDVLAAYERDEAHGRAAFRKAMNASGISPPDVPELRWSAIMGVEEVQAHEAVSGVLEMAIEAGEIRPGTRGWRGRQQAVVRRALLLARPDLAAGCWLDQVHEERVERWLTSRGESRRELLGRVRDAVTGPKVPVPDDVAQHVAPVRWLLERAETGLDLTATNRLRPATVAELARGFGWSLEVGTRQTEGDVWEVVAVRHLARRVGALRRSGRRLVLTTAGRRLLADESGLWQALCGGLLDDSGFPAAAGEIALVVLLEGEADTDDELSEAVAARIVEENWTGQSSGARPGRRAALQGLSDLRWGLEVLRLVDRPPGATWWDSPTWRLNAAGRAAALVALQARALRPRRSIWESR